MLAESSFDDNTDFNYIEQEQSSIYDPFESFNRKNYNFYIKLYSYTGYYLTTYIYKYKGPYLGSRLNSFKNNLNEPRNILNHLMQGKINSALESILRFTLNTSIGLFGFFDISLSLGLEQKVNDFGATFAYYGAPEGPFLIILGPFNARDTLGLISSWSLGLYSGTNNLVFNSSNTLQSLTIQNNFTLLSSGVVIFEGAEIYNSFSLALEQSLDPYTLIKVALYNQRKQILEKIKLYD
jgi:phospholipid-binding lipoprotein MlaA